MNEIVVEMLKYGSISIIYWLVRIINRCMELAIGKKEWKLASFFLVYKGKGDRRECAVTILSIPTNVCGRILIIRIAEVMEEQGGFKSGRGCTNYLL